MTDFNLSALFDFYWRGTASLASPDDTSMDFSHSSCKALSGVLNNLPRHFPVSADAIASQLGKNGIYEAV